jgi:hypothetical protein
VVLTHVPQGRRLVRRCPTYQTVRRAMPLPKEVVYRLLKAGRVVYYGITKQNLRVRGRQHFRSGKDFDTIEKLVELDDVRNVRKARLVEETLIRETRKAGVELLNKLPKH